MGEGKKCEPKETGKAKCRTTVRRRIADFKKANESIGLWVIEGHLSLLSRKLYNVFVSAAQKQKRPGVNAPNNEPASAYYFWIALQDVINDTRFNSNDYETLKAHALELQNVRVAGESATTWTSERLLSGVKIYNSKGLRSKGGDIWLGFSFPPEVMQIVLEPTIYTKFSLYYQTQLRTASSLVLYEICRRYASSPSHLTQKDDWSRWYYRITGAQLSENVPEYKYFKRDHLMKSIADINAVTDIEVELIEQREGRRVSNLQFKVHPKTQVEESASPAPLINTALINRLVALGFTGDEAAKVVANYQEDVVIAHLELVEARVKNKKAAPLDSAAAYFKNAITNQHARSKALDQNPVFTQTTPAEVRSERECRMSTNVGKTLEKFQALSREKQDEIFSRFRQAADGSLQQFIKKGLKMTLVQKEFSNWLLQNGYCT